MSPVTASTSPLNTSPFERTFFNVCSETYCLVQWETGKVSVALNNEFHTERVLRLALLSIQRYCWEGEKVKICLTILITESVARVLSFSLSHSRAWFQTCCSLHLISFAFHACLSFSLEAVPNSLFSIVTLSGCSGQTIVSSSCRSCVPIVCPVWVRRCH